jgi:hypothetical protein
VDTDLIRSERLRDPDVAQKFGLKQFQVTDIINAFLKHADKTGSQADNRYFPPFEFKSEEKVVQGRSR